MAASVLGKRTRQSTQDQEKGPSSPAKRHQTRRSALHIFEDASEPERPAKVLTRRSGRSRATKVQSIGQDSDNLKDENKSTRDLSIPSFEEALKENVPPASTTPTTVRFKDAFSDVTIGTPRHRVRLGGKIITPRSQRVSGKPRPNTVYAAARQLFTQSSSSTRIIGREQERQRLRDFIAAGCETRKGGCLYISGPPGTGKSALVQEIFDEYRSQNNLRISIVNCVTSRTTTEISTQLAQDFSTSMCTAKDMNKHFTTNASTALHLVLMDEIDNLLDGDCELLYSMFEWALHRSSKLLLVGIANALDLTDRFMPRLKSRNLKPDLLPFLPYTASDMSTIITQKLQSLLPSETSAPPGYVPIIHPTAIKLIGSKIAAQTGDLRKAFNLARRAIDQIEKETPDANEGATTPTKQPLGEIQNCTAQMLITPQPSPLKEQSRSKPQLTIESAPQATIKHVARLANAIFNHNTVSRLGGLNLQQKAVLCSLVASEGRQERRDPFKTPSKSSKRVPSVKDLFEKYGRLCQRDDGLLPVLKNTEFRDVVTSLETLGLIHESAGRISSLLTPSKTPSKTGRSMDERQFVSAVSEGEMRESLTGPGSELLQRLLEE